MRPLGTLLPFSLFFLSKGLLHFHKSLRGATARETTTSKLLSLKSSALECVVMIFLIPVASVTSFITFSFLLMLSTS